MLITLKNLHLAAPQQVLDQAFNHLMTQKQQSAIFDEWGNMKACKYRMEDSSLKCGAGIFIAEDEYNPRMEGCTWNGLVESGFVPTNAHKKLIMDIQGIHDSWAVEFWPDHFMTLTRRYDLAYPILLAEQENAHKDPLGML